MAAAGPQLNGAMVNFTNDRILNILERIVQQFTSNLDLLKMSGLFIETGDTYKVEQIIQLYNMGGDPEITCENVHDVLASIKDIVLRIKGIGETDQALHGSLLAAIQTLGPAGTREKAFHKFNQYVDALGGSSERAQNEIAGIFHTLIRLGVLTLEQSEVTGSKILQLGSFIGEIIYEALSRGHSASDLTFQKQVRENKMLFACILGYPLGDEENDDSFGKAKAKYGQTFEEQYLSEQVAARETALRHLQSESRETERRAKTLRGALSSAKGDREQNAKETGAVIVRRAHSLQNLLLRAAGQDAEQDSAARAALAISCSRVSALRKVVGDSRAQARKARHRVESAGETLDRAQFKQALQKRANIRREGSSTAATMSLGSDSDSSSEERRHSGP
tara:strand:+ start:68230 stop:69408 length:1179 start_codon:yes stop_codon:yes gene_type:complete